MKRVEKPMLNVKSGIKYLKYSGKLRERASYKE